MNEKEDRKKKREIEIERERERERTIHIDIANILYFPLVSFFVPSQAKAYSLMKFTLHIFRAENR